MLALMPGQTVYQVRPAAALSPGELELAQIARASAPTRRSRWHCRSYVTPFMVTPGANLGRVRQIVLDGVALHQCP